MITRTARRWVVLAVLILLAAACGSSGPSRSEAIDLLTDDLGLEEDVASCIVDGIEESDVIALSDITDDDASSEKVSAFGAITSDCVAADLGLTTADDSTDSDEGDESSDSDEGDTDGDAEDAATTTTAANDSDLGTAQAPPGTDPVLDALWTECAEGDDDACSTLYWQSDFDSEYEAFGLSCGGRGGTCNEVVGDADGIDGDEDALFDFSDMDTADPAPGTDPGLDELWDDCAAGSAYACDTLYFDSPLGSDYERFGFSCGAREIANCAEVLGDDYPEDTSSPDGNDAEGLSPSSPPPGTDAELDALWELCAAGDAEGCDDLFWESPIDSIYEAYGLSCGGRGEGDCATVIANAG